MAKDFKARMIQRGQNSGKSASDIAAEVARMETGGEQPAGIEPDRIPIADILPDPIQPRRAMPEILRARWCDGAPITGVLAQWSNDVQQDAARFGFDLDWNALLFGNVFDDISLQDRAVQPDSRLFLELLRLANSIHKHGLEQPITVYRIDGDLYRVQVGERRLLAFYILNWLLGSDYATIPAIIQDAYDPFAQALENGARENLNAIGRARQLAIILKELHQQPLPDTGQPGQSWYAEAAALRVPHGMADEVALMIGLNSPRMTRHYLDLLTLPGEVWNWADQFNWTEGKIRGMIKRAQNSEQLLRIAQDEVTLALGGTVKAVVKSPTQKVIKRAQSSVASIRRVLDYDDESLNLLPSHERQELVNAAKDVLRRFQ